MQFKDSIKVTLTVTNGAYTIGDSVGGLLTFSNAVREVGGVALVHSLKLGGVVAIPYNLWFLNANLATNAPDLDPFTFVVADQPKVLGVVPIVATDYIVAGPSAFYTATVRNIGLQIQAAAATQDIYAYLVATAVTAPGTTVLDLTVDFIP